MQEEMELLQKVARYSEAGKNKLCLLRLLIQGQRHSFGPLT